MVARILTIYAKVHHEKSGKPPSKKEMAGACKVVETNMVKGKVPKVDDIGAGENFKIELFRV